MDREIGRVEHGVQHVLDDKTRALVCFGALTATGGRAACYERHVDNARAAGASDAELLGVLLALAPTIGMADLVASSTRVAHGLGYDVEDALEQLDQSVSELVEMTRDGAILPATTPTTRD